MKTQIVISIFCLFNLSCSNERVKKSIPTNEDQITNIISTNRETIPLKNKKLSKLTFSNGQVLEKGEYRIGQYEQCCFSGPCTQNYKYKAGDWEYFYPDGRTKAKGTYTVKKINLVTSCEGGANILFGIINDDWEYLNQNNTKLPITDSIRKQLEKVQIGTSKENYLIPNKSRNRIDWVNLE